MATLQTVERYNAVERAFHWTFALTFLGLLASGLAMEHPDLRGIPFLGSKLAREAHLTLALLIFCLPALAAAWDDFHSTTRMLAAAFRWDLHGLRRLVRAVGRVSGSRPARPVEGRFNTGQKLNALAVLVLTAGLALTGALLAPHPGPFPQTWREVLYLTHTTLAYLTLPLVGGHVFLAVCWPSTRPAFWGMVHGRVSLEWARKHYPVWLEGLDARQDGQ